MTSRFLADAAWLGGDELARHVLLEVEGGVFARVQPGSADPTATELRGWVVPGLVNAHSHAFHRLLRGRTQRLGGGFWEWRDRMYETAASLEPDTYERVATAVFSEMALAGITTVGEFHYLHHPMEGGRYRDPNEMGHALVRAARRAGIRIALLDAGYLRPGPGGGDLSPVQRRFADRSVEDWLARASALADTYRGEPDVAVGLAPHSVRALSPADLARFAEGRDPRSVVHVHVSEQTAENEACIAESGLTPVGLLSQVDLLGPTTTAVHATHLTDEDIVTLGASGTGVCYCATTERDLADGIGPATAVVAAGSPLSVGTDSHAVIDLLEETRGVELHERLTTHRRGLFAPTELMGIATANGARALGLGTGRIAVGEPADFVVMDGQSTRTAGLPARVDSVVFGASGADVTDVWVAGRRIVESGRHHAWEAARPALAGFS